MLDINQLLNTQLLHVCHQLLVTFFISNQFPIINGGKLQSQIFPYEIDLISVNRIEIEIELKFN